jgi:hypothetical protein
LRCFEMWRGRQSSSVEALPPRQLVAPSHAKARRRSDRGGRSCSPSAPLDIATLASMGTLRPCAKQRDGCRSRERAEANEQLACLVRQRCARQQRPAKHHRVNEQRLSPRAISWVGDEALCAVGWQQTDRREPAVFSDCATVQLTAHPLGEVALCLWVMFDCAAVQSWSQDPPRNGGQHFVTGFFWTVRRGTIPSRIHPEMGGGTGVMARLCGRTHSIWKSGEEVNCKTALS